MIHYNAKAKVITMDLVDLDHCGFDYDCFDWELSCRGIDDKNARWPIALIVNFAGGSIVTPETTEDAKRDRVKADMQFAKLVEKLQ